MATQTNDNVPTFFEIHKLLETLDKYSDNEIIQRILNEVFQDKNRVGTPSKGPAQPNNDDQGSQTKGKFGSK